MAISFKRDLSFALDFVRDATVEQVRLSFTEAFVSVVAKTPVDTGAAKNSWYCSIGVTNGGEGAREESQSGVDSLEAITSTVRNAPLAGKILLYNNLPYIEKLEDGYSLQAPVGMVKLTEAEWPQIVRKNFNIAGSIIR